MTIPQKLTLFKKLVQTGFKEIEVGFPSASDTEFAFNRCLIEEGHIPDDVCIQVLVPAREELIDRTIKSLIGVKHAIIHLYNSTSPAQRRIVFGKTKQEILEMAVHGAKLIQERLHLLKGSDITLQYSPESFSLTEVDYAQEVAEAVMAVWRPTPEHKMILNLPETVESAPPNVYADQIEWICEHIKNRNSLIISLHTHNDRGTGIAAAELGLLAGADRVEGTLFGNGERTGNLDVVTLALNLYMQGIDPCLDFSNLPHLIETYQQCTGMQVPPRHPYAGELVFTAFSGSHQDAIKKGLAAWKASHNSGTWEVPYLPIDPQDIGRDYQVIRVNSQSGKGGVAYLLEDKFGIELPKPFQKELGDQVNRQADRLGIETKADDIRELLWREYVNRPTPYLLHKVTTTTNADRTTCQALLKHNNQTHEVLGAGNGPLAALVHGLTPLCGTIKLLSYHEHALGQGENAEAIAYLQIENSAGQTSWGVGISPNIETSSFNALISALNRLGKCYA